MRVATAVLIILASATVVYAQQIERSPFYPAAREKTLRPLFPTGSPDLPLPSWSVQQGERPESRQFVTAPRVTPPRSGSVCLQAVPVDPSIDREFVWPVPNTRGLPMRMIPMPPCVTLAPQSPR